MADNVLAQVPRKRYPTLDEQMRSDIVNYLSRLKSDFVTSGERAGQGLGQVIDDGNYLEGVPRVVLGGLGALSAPVSAAVSPVLGPLLQPVGEAVNTYVGQPVERATGYPADITNELFLTGVTAGAAPVLRPVLRGSGNFLAKVGDAAEAGLNRVGYTARPQAGTFFSGVPLSKLDEAAQAADDGIIAYHGSPHSFDKFSMDKIGTGEGAQAYGHGLYFADAERVANSYRGSPELKYARLNGHMSAAEEIAYDMAMQNNPDWSHDAWKVMRSRGIADDQIFDAIDKIQPGRGSMYQVRLNVKPDELLDWDKPLSEQPKALQSAIRDMKPDWTGGQIYESSKLVPGDFSDKAKATEALKARGIKGIRYKDAGSRGGEGGTHNYVIFDDNRIKILKKYGIPMTAGAGGAMMVSGEAMPPELAAQLQGGT